MMLPNVGLGLQAVLVVLIVVVPIFATLRPDPRDYFRFVTAAWEVRVERDEDRSRWLPMYFGALLLSHFVSQAVHCFLHYPLLYRVLGASVLEIGIIDALTSCSTVIATLGPLVRLSRHDTFLFQAGISVFGYIMCIAIGTRLVGAGWAGLLLAFLGGSVAGLPVAFMEYGVMRNDAKKDIVDSMDRASDWADEDDVQAMLCQLAVVLKYPASLLASVALPPLLANNVLTIFDLYMLIGLICVMLWGFLSWCWSGDADTAEIAQHYHHHSHERHDSSSGLGGLLQLVVVMGSYTALLAIVRNGYMRMLNLRILEMGGVSAEDVGGIVSTVFGISICFFWLADIATTEAQQGKRQARSSLVEASPSWQSSRWSVVLGLVRWRRAAVGASARPPSDHNFGKVCAGMCSFGLMAAGHGMLGLASGTRGLLMSGLLFGLGQAISTGLASIWKDEVRDLLRKECDDPAREKRVMSCLGVVTTTSEIINAMVTGFLGHVFGLSVASLFYAGLSVLGLLGTLLFRKGLPGISTASAHKQGGWRARLLCNE